jgi:hypothetical protein
MMDERNDRSEQGFPAWIEAGRVEFLLRTEVAFWRDLLESCGADVPPESIERMRQAAALAELRLLQLYSEPAHDPRSTTRPAGTSGPGSPTLS